MAKIVILGGSGFVGTHLNLWFQKTNHTVISVDVKNPRLVGLLDNYKKIDIVEQLPPHLMDGVDYVIWVAGLTSHVEGQTAPFAYQHHNIRGLINIIQACRFQSRPPKLIYVSTTSIFGAQPDLIDEKTTPWPKDMYSITKLTGEYLVSLYRRWEGFQACILRLPNCYGPHGNQAAKYGVVNHWLALAERGESLLVFGDGDQRRAFLYIEDAIRAIVAPITTLGKNIFDPAHVFYPLPPKSHTIREMALAIAKVYGVRVEYVDWPDDRLGVEIGDHVFSQELSRDFQGITGWKPLYDLERGIQQTYENFSNRRIGTHRQQLHQA